MSDASIWSFQRRIKDGQSDVLISAALIVIASLALVILHVTDYRDLNERLTVYGLAYDVRDLLAEPPDRPMEHLSPFHPMRRIATAVRQQGYLRGLNL